MSESQANSANAAMFEGVARKVWILKQRRREGDGHHSIIYLALWKHSVRSFLPLADDHRNIL